MLSTRIRDRLAARRLPRLARLVLCGALIGIGAFLAVKPFQSLAVLIVLVSFGLVLSGIQLLVSPGGPWPWLRRGLGTAWILAGVLVLTLPGVSIRLLAVFTGIAMLLEGAGRLGTAIRGRSEERSTAAFLGPAGIVLGALSLGWPDLTVLVVALLFGVRVLGLGVMGILEVVVTNPPTTSEPASPGAGRRPDVRAGHAGAVLALFVSVFLLAVSTVLNAAAPSVDGFYDPPEVIPETPGMLIDSAELDRLELDGSHAWRLLYSTQANDGNPTVASAILVVPDRPEKKPMPVIMWMHGTTGVDRSCAPSVLGDPLDTGAAVLGEAIDRGWAVVAPDYVGLGTPGPHAYLVGAPAARAGLDAVRAAQQLPGVELAAETVVWGHSQGGHAALWTGTLASAYAPDVTMLGVAAVSPAADLIGLAENLDDIGATGNLFGAFVITGYSAAYSDVRFDAYVRPAARLIAREMASRCLPSPEVFVSVVTVLVIDKDIWASDPTTGSLGQRLRDNIPAGPFSAPLLIAQGADDPLVTRSSQNAYVAQRCAGGGVALEYRVYEGLGHNDIMEAASPMIPELLSWTQDRLGGGPVPAGCPGS